MKIKELEVEQKELRKELLLRRAQLKHTQARLLSIRLEIMEIEEP